MEEIIKAYQRFLEGQGNAPESLYKGIDYLEFVKENLCSEDAFNSFVELLDKKKAEGAAIQLHMYAIHMLQLLSFLNDYTQVTKKVCDKIADELAVTTEQRRNLYQTLFNDIKIWKF